MRTRHASGCPNQADLLPTLDGVANRDKRLAEMEIAGYDSGTMVDVNDVAGEKEFVDERNHAAIRRIHRLTYRSPEIDAEVAAGHVAVEETPASKLARHD
jgi:hypothetical protein